MKKDRLITLAIHTYPKALILKGVLESQGIAVVIQNVNLLKPVISPGVRVRINEKDLPHALEILEKLIRCLGNQKFLTNHRKIGFLYRLIFLIILYKHVD